MKSMKIYGIILSALVALLLAACTVGDEPRNGVPEGMVAVYPSMPEMYSMIQRDAGDTGRSGQGLSRTYDDKDETEAKLGKLVSLPEGSTVWLIAKNAIDGTYIKKSYVVHNSGGDVVTSYLLPCTVDDEGNPITTESAPLYLEENTRYEFSAISPARKIDEAAFASTGQVSFAAYNGEYFYANDWRYSNTRPEPVEVKGDNSAVYQVTLKPMMNQTARLRFLIGKGTGVHDLDIQPAGIEVSGLQDDDPDGIAWHMSQAETDEPIDVKHGAKSGIYHQYNYEIDELDRVRIDVPVLPMRSISKPVIVLFRLKVNGVPTSYEIMLNEKDFKAGYSYGYYGTVSIGSGIDVITWQFVSWDLDVDFPF